MSEVSPVGAAPEKNGFSRVPVMSCAEAKAFEKAFFSRAEMTEEAAMRAAGTAVGAGVLRECAGADFSRLAVLAGKGHNGGDAVRAATRIFAEKKCRVLLVFFAAENAGGLAPLTRKFLEEFLAAVPADMRRVVFLPESAAALPPEVPAFVAAPHVLLDGVFGHSFRPPFPPRALAFLREILAARAENSPCCSVDLPSGLCDAGAECCPLRADFTFPTGILKRPLLDFPEAAGRVVPADIGFSGFDETSVAAADPADFLRKIFAPRPALCDKRAFGHALIVGGSRGMPGALMLNALAALRSRTDAGYRRIVRHAGLVLPDGAGLIGALKLVGTPIQERIPGVEFTEHLCKRAAYEGWRVWFLGGKPGEALTRFVRLLIKNHREAHMRAIGLIYQDIYRASDNKLCFKGVIELVCLVNGKLAHSKEYDEAFGFASK